MDFIIVAVKDLEPLGRQVAHRMSLLEEHDGSFWTIQHYKDNEAQIRNKQPVIFLGNNDEVTKPLTKVLPERFTVEGTTCYYGGTKAILIAETPTMVSREEVARLKSVAETQQEELRKRNKLLHGGIAVGLTVALGAIGIGGYVIYRIVNAQKRRFQEYRKLQYDCALTRFFTDEFEAYVRGVRKAGESLTDGLTEFSEG